MIHNSFNLHMKVFNINLRVSYNVIKLQQKKSNNNLSILQLLVLCSLLVIVSNFRGTSTSSIITSKFVLHGEREKFFISMYFQLVDFDQILFLYHTHCKIQQIPNLNYFYYWRLWELRKAYFFAFSVAMNSKKSFGTG